jgi:4-hydroxybenzoate polyprenyltransferase
MEKVQDEPWSGRMDPLMWKQLQHFLGMIRFSHTLFALPFALLSALLAWSQYPFHWLHLVGIILCMVFARSAAMGFNRVVDRDIDAQNPRTAQRHIPAGVISVRQAWMFVILSGLGFILSTLAFWPNPWPLVLSVPILLFLCGYSYVKRFSMWCHYWLAAALMISPMAAWLAITGGLNLIPVLLSLSVFFWVGGFDIIYACQDAEFDREAKLFSLPARLGLNRALWIARISHLLMICTLLGMWYVAHLGPIFLIAILIVAGMLVFEHRLVSPQDLTKVNVAFFQVNWMLSVGMLCCGCIDLWTRHLWR